MPEEIAWAIIVAATLAWFGYIYLFTEIRGNKYLLGFMVSFTVSFSFRIMALRVPRHLDLLTWLQATTAVIAFAFLVRLVWFAYQYAKSR